MKRQLQLKKLLYGTVWFVLSGLLCLLIFCAGTLTESYAATTTATTANITDIPSISVSPSPSVSIASDSGIDIAQTAQLDVRIPEVNPYNDGTSGGDTPGRLDGYRVTIQRATNILLGDAQQFDALRTAVAQHESTRTSAGNTPTYQNITSLHTADGTAIIFDTIMEQYTNTAGVTQFTHLPLGVYVIHISGQGAAQQHSFTDFTPLVVSLPTQAAAVSDNNNQSGWVYDVDITAKPLAAYTPPEPQQPRTPNKLVNTGSSITIPWIVNFTILGALLVLFGIMLCIRIHTTHQYSREFLTHSAMQS